MIDDDEAEANREAVRQAMRSYNTRTPRAKAKADDQKPGDEGER